MSGFNSQPPEGGWLLLRLLVLRSIFVFQLTAARRRLARLCTILAGCR